MTRPKCVQASFASSVSEIKKTHTHSPRLIRQTKNPLAWSLWCILRKKLTQKSGNKNSGGSGGRIPPKHGKKPNGFPEGLKTQNGFPSAKNESILCSVNL